MSVNTDLLICACATADHQVIFRYDTDDSDKMVYCTIHLSKLPFLKRLKCAFMYLMGYQSRYGAFEEVILDQTHVKQLQKVVDYLNDSPKTNKK